MTLEIATMLLANALREAAGMHGVPNNFSCGFLERVHGGPPAMIAGKIARRRMLQLKNALADQPWAPTLYYDGQFWIPVGRDGR